MPGYHTERGDVLLSLQMILTGEEEARRAQARGRGLSTRPVAPHPPRPPLPAPSPRPAMAPVPAAPRPPVSAVRPRPAEQPAAMVDSVTGAGTRRALRRDIELARDTQMDGRSPAVVTLHLEGLDQIRASEGPDAADAVVRAFAEVAPFALRARDRIYRSGPSEMIVLMPGVDRSGVVEARSALETSLARFLVGKKLPAVTLTVRSVAIAAAAR